MKITTTFKPDVEFPVYVIFKHMGKSEPKLICVMKDKDIALAYQKHLEELEPPIDKTYYFTLETRMLL